MEDYLNEPMGTYSPQEKDKKISAAIKKLKALFRETDKATKTKVSFLIDKVAFMSVSLEELQSIINCKGYTEEYQNGANQSGIKKSAAIDIYNSLIRNYVTAVKQLCDIAPDAAPKKDALLNYISR